MDLLRSLFLLLSYILFTLAKEIESLEITQFVVPRLAIVGKSYELRCSIRASEGKLAIIKWYRNDSEIYRVQIKPAKTKIFPATGININEAKSSFGTILLDNVTHETAGNFRCEVTKEPDFTTEERESTMVVTEMLPQVSGDSNRSSPSTLISNQAAASSLITLTLILHLLTMLTC